METVVLNITICIQVLYIRKEDLAKNLKLEIAYSSWKVTACDILQDKFRANVFFNLILQCYFEEDIMVIVKFN